MKPRTLTLPEWDLVLAAAVAHSAKYGALFAVMYDAALLSAEVEQLTLRRLRQQDGAAELYVHRCKKTPAAWWHLTSATTRLLRLWLKERYPDWRSRGAANQKAIFPGYNDEGALQRSGVYYAVRVVAGEVGIKALSPRVIRSSRVRHLIEAADRGGVFPLESVLANLTTLIGAQAAQYAVMQYFTETRSVRVTRGMVQVGR